MVAGSLNNRILTYANTDADTQIKEAMMAETFVVVSKVKKLAKEMGMRTGADAIEVLSRAVEAKLKEGVEKAKAAGKKTVQGIDVQ